MEILISEDRVKTMTVYADIIVAYITQEAVCGVAFNFFIGPFFLNERTPLMGIMTGRTGDVPYIYLSPGFLVEYR